VRRWKKRSAATPHARRIERPAKLQVDLDVIGIGPHPAVERVEEQAFLERREREDGAIGVLLRCARSAPDQVRERQSEGVKPPAPGVRHGERGLRAHRTSVVPSAWMACLSKSALAHDQRT